MLRLTLLTCLIALNLVNTASAGPLEWWNERKLAKTTVETYADEVLRYTADTMKVAVMCSTEAKDSLNRFINETNAYENNQRSLALSNCCRAFQDTSAGLVLSPILRGSAFRAPATSLPSQHKDIVRFAEKIAQRAANKTKAKLPKEVFAEMLYDWQVSMKVCRPLVR